MDRAVDHDVAHAGRARTARRTADELDFVARAGKVTVQPPLLLVSGVLDCQSRSDAEGRRGRGHRRRPVQSSGVSGLPETVLGMTAERNCGTARVRVKS